MSHRGGAGARVTPRTPCPRFFFALSSLRSNRPPFNHLTSCRAGARPLSEVRGSLVLPGARTGVAVRQRHSQSTTTAARYPVRLPPLRCSIHCKLALLQQRFLDSNSSSSCINC